MPEWEKIASSERYQGLSDSQKMRVARGYFKENIESSEQFKALPQRDKDRAKINFYNDRDTVPGEKPEGLISRAVQGAKEYFTEDVPLGYKVHARDPKAAITAVATESPPARALQDIAGAVEGGMSLASAAVGFPAGVISGAGELMNQVMAGGGERFDYPEAKSEGQLAGVDLGRGQRLPDFDWKKVREAAGEVMETFTYQPRTLKGQQTVEPVGKAFEHVINKGAELVTPEDADENTLERNKYFIEVGMVLSPAIFKRARGAISVENPKQIKAFVKEGERLHNKNLKSAEAKIKAGQDLTPEERYVVSRVEEGSVPRGTAEIKPEKAKAPEVKEPLVTPTVGLATEKMKVTPTEIKTPEGIKTPKKAVDLLTDKKVRDRFENATIKKKPVAEKLQEGVESIKKNVFRGTVAELPRGTAKERGFFAEARDSIQTLGRQGGVAINKTIRGLEAVTQDFVRAKDVEGYNLFSQKVLLDDLAFEMKQGRDLPYGYTPDILARDIAKTDFAVDKAPNVKAALARRRQLMEAVTSDYQKAMKGIGIDLRERFANPDYFRHQVLEHVEERGLFGAGSKRRLKAPTGRGFLKRRKGSAKDINRDYLQTESEVLAQMHYDTAKAKMLKDVDLIYNTNKKRTKAQEKQLQTWDGEYTDWQPREDSVFYRTFTIPEKAALEAMDLGVAEVMGKDVRKAMIMGQKAEPWRIPVEIAAALDDMTVGKRGFAEKISKETMRKWKQWQLVSPRRVVKYNLRNISGDADAAFVGNSQGFLSVPRASVDLLDVMLFKKSPPKRLADWLDMGGLEGTLQAQEMANNIKTLKTFSRFHRPEKGVTKAVTGAFKKTWDGYWKISRGATDFREAILRYANYLDYLDQIKKSPEGRPENFGASLREEVMGLKTPEQKAYKLSNELLGAYDDISPVGQALREHMIPFWSWNEVNFKRYKRFAQNAYMDGKMTEALGRKAAGTAIKSPFIAYRAGKLLLKAYAFQGALQAWNTGAVPYITGEDVESQLPDRKRTRAHLILLRPTKLKKDFPYVEFSAKDKDGKALTFDRLGAFSDFLDWAGLDAAPDQWNEYLAGRKTLGEIMQYSLEAPLNKLWQGSFPLVKLAGETALQRSTYPELFRPRTIKDRGQHIADSFGLGNEYKAIKGLPSRPYSESKWDLLLYRVHPGEAAMADIYELKRQYMKKIGKEAEGFWLTARGQAMSHYKTSLRLEDKEAAEKYFMEWIRLSVNAGLTPKQLNTSFKTSMTRLHPLSGISPKDMPGFLEFIGPGEKDTVKRAVDFYLELTGRVGKDIGERINKRKGQTE